MAIDSENQQRRTNLSPTKQALLEQRLRGKQVRTTPKGRIPPRKEHDPAPLSSTQRRLWFLDQFQPDNPVYNIPIALHLQGALNVAALEHSLNQIIKRHEILRTTFTTIEGQPVQVIAPELVLYIDRVDLTTWPIEERAEEIKRLIGAESLLSFNLEHGPLLRASLLQIAVDEQILLLTVHHIIADAWSLGVVYTRELITHYMAFMKGLPSPLPALPIQYADFSVWQNTWLRESSQLQEQLTYWKEHLADAQTVLELPTDYPRPLLQSFHGASQELTLAPELTVGLRALSQEAGVTLFMTLVAVLNVLFSRYTGQTDILLGTPIANRTLPELEELIGFFANTLVLRTDLTGNPSFREILKRVEKETTAAYAHQEFPFEKLVEELHPERDLSRSPLVQVMFSHNNTPMQEVTLPGLTISMLPPQVKTSKFDLTLMMEDVGNRLQGYFEYDTDLFEAETIKRFATHFQRILAAVVANPDRKLADIPLLSEAERHLLLDTWNQTQVPLTEAQYIHVLIEQQVQRTPDAPALLFAGRERSYGQLNREANQLAHRLREMGVQAEVLVGVSLPRSIELVVALLAVLKAGGVYVPLDPEYPSQRLQNLIDDAGLSIILTQHELRSHFAQELQIIEVDEGWNEGMQDGVDNLACEGQGEQGAYMIYTSGSTGQPKGVINIHRAVANRLTWGQRTYPLTPADRVLQKTPFTFDVSVSEFFWPLLAGATLVLAKPGGQKDPVYLVEAIEQYQITSIHFVPSMFSLFLQQPELAQRCRSLRQVFTSGEALTHELADRFFARFPAPAVRLHNLYGPTEAAVEVTFWECERELTHPSSNGGVPIGRPIANVQTYVLDEQMQPVPIGVAGELYLGGIALARGYHRREELSRQKFVPHPFVEGQRLYKTGDRARYRRDGAIEFLGRTDQQVKLRGIRIELGEVEALLEETEPVRQAVVLLREDQQDNAQLVGYVVLKQGENREVAGIKQALRQRVPDYLVPTIIIILEEFPLLSSGKVDRKRLPIPQQDRSQVGGRYVGARTPLEAQLVEIWQEVLGREEIGVQDNFFELGGHSLKATQVASRVQSEFGVRVPLRGLFEEATIEGLARLIEQEATQVGAVSSARIPVSRRDVKHLEDLLQALGNPPRENVFAALGLSPVQDTRTFDVFPVSSAQQRMWVLNQLAPESPSYTISGGFRLLGSLDEAVLHESLNEIVRRHETLRTVFVAIGGEPVQVIQPAQPVLIPLTDLSQFPSAWAEQELQAILKEETRTPFSLAHGPLFRPRLLRLAPHEHVLLLTVHHIVFDGWSQGILTQEFIHLYNAFLQRQSSPLAPLKVQYADFAQWQRSWLQGAEMQGHLSFWQEYLSDLPAPVELPLDHPRPAVQTFAGAGEAFQVPAGLTQQLAALSRQEGATLFMTLLSALQVVLARYSGQRDLLIGTPIANRMHAELEELIGCFINTLLIRTRLEEEASFRELLQQVRQSTLDAYAHQEVPFEKLVEALHPERDLSRTPLVQILFVLQNAPQSALQLRDLAVSPLPTLTHMAKFDLTLHMWEQNGTLEGLFIYNTDLFEAETIGRIATHFQRILAAVVANPERKLVDIPLLSEAERHLLLDTWNQTQVPLTEEPCVHVLIEQQVQRTPAAPALLSTGRERTYEQLNREANQLAHRLREVGVGPEVLVGVSLPRSIELVVALLAVLKAGGVYVPLDPEYPTERLQNVIDDAGLSILLTQRELRSRFVREGLQIIEVDEGWNEGMQDGVDNLEGERRGEQGAYMIYTSGSTGQPKGVINTQQALANRLLWGQHTYPLTATDRLLHQASCGFDFALCECLWPLLAGATLVLAKPGGQQDPAYLVEAIEEQQITTIHFVPSLFSLFLQEPALAPRCRSLRLVFTGGEALSRELAERFFAQFPDQRVQLYNQYGPTEAAIDATFWECERELTYPSSNGGVPIGRPIANVQTYVLDAQMQPVPIGVPGELHLGGIALARGYHQREELSRQKFVPHPFVEGQRLYKTGDRVRFRRDGAIEFLGRMDQQVKLRGFRIELGEVEALLQEIEPVRQAVVLLREDQPGDAHLVGYVVLKTGEAVEAAELKQAMRQRVPDYLVPASIILLEEFPVLSSGKVDRKRLPIPQQDRSQVGSRYVGARTPLEGQLVEIWQEVLGREQIGVQDNFFELGGHSLKAIQLLTRLREKLQKNLSLGHFFQAQTIAEMATLLDKRSEPASTCLFPIRKVVSTRPPLFLFHPAGGEILPYRFLVERLEQDLSVYGLQSRALTGTMPEYSSIEMMADEYAATIRQQQPAGPYFLLGWSMGGVLAVAVAANLERSGHKVQFIGLLDSYLTADQSVAGAGVDPLIDLGLAFGGKLMQAFANLSDREQEQLREKLQILSERERFQQVLNWGKERKLFPGDLSVETFLSQAALVSAHRALLKDYRAPVVNAPMAAWWASEHTQARTDWGKYTRSGLQEKVEEGNHFTIMQLPSIEIVAQEISLYLG